MSVAESGEARLSRLAGLLLPACEALCITKMNLSPVPYSSLRAPTRQLARLLWVWVLACGCNAFDANLISPDDSSGTDPDKMDGSMPDMDARAHDSDAQAGAGGAAGSSGRSGAGGDGGRDGAPDPMDSGHHDASEDGGPLTDASQDAASDASVDGSSDGSGSDCPKVGVPSLCEELPELAAAPVIDGELDCGLTLESVTPDGWNGTGSVPADHHLAFAAGHRSDGLYVYVQVQDPTLEPHAAGDAIHCGDAVEIYVESDGVVDASGDYSDPGTMQFVIAAPSPSSPGTVEALRFVSGGQRSWPSPMLATRVRPDGYAVEVFITAADMNLAAWTLAPKVGLDIAVGVSGTSGARCAGRQLGQYFLRVDPAGGSCGGEPWCDTGAFCLPALVSR